VLEAVKGEERAFVALVGWESVAVHEVSVLCSPYPSIHPKHGPLAAAHSRQAYHHTRHFREEGRKVLLDEAEGGYAHYGHIAFAHHEAKGENGEKGRGGAKL
jgi:hypothetical protein